MGTRAFFYKSAGQAISYARRHEKELVVVQLSIDNFRELFIKVGKGTSSALVKKVGEILSKHSRQEDIVCRMGLDGFTALLRTCDLAGAVKMNERVLEMIGNIKCQTGVEQEHVTASVGVAKVEITDDTTVDYLLQAAEKYVHQSQQAGGNRVSYDKSMAKVEAVGELTVDQALHLISRGESGKIVAQIDRLIKRILPLLGVYARVNPKGVKILIEKLRAAIK